MTKRAFTELLTELGYQFDRDAKRTFWSNAVGQEIAVPHGSGDVPKHLVLELRRRHPDSPLLKRGPGHGKGKNHKTFHPDRHPRPLVAVPTVSEVAKPKVQSRDRDLTGCDTCGRRWWFGDPLLNPEGRRCPSARCTGHIVLGRDARGRDFRYEVAA